MLVWNASWKAKQIGLLRGQERDVKTGERENVFAAQRSQKKMNSVHIYSVGRFLGSKIIICFLN